MVGFKLRLEQTYWSKGFFNVPVDYERFLSHDDGQVDIFIGTAHEPTSGRMSRSANRNATPRVFGNKALQDFFQTYFTVGEFVPVEFISPRSMRVGGKVNLDGPKPRIVSTAGVVTRKRVPPDEVVKLHAGPPSGASVDGYLVVVSCGDHKIWKRNPHAGPTAARDAYTSATFTKSRRYAQYFAPDSWMVLSAKYGFIDPDFIIPESYNVTFSDPTAISVAALREQVAEGGLARFKTVGVLGSNMYWRQVERAFEGSAVTCRHVNGNVSYPPQFHTLVSELLAKDRPFRDDEDA